MHRLKKKVDELMKHDSGKDASKLERTKPNSSGASPLQAKNASQPIAQLPKSNTSLVTSNSKSSGSLSVLNDVVEKQTSEVVGPRVDLWEEAFESANLTEEQKSALGYTRSKSPALESARLNGNQKAALGPSQNLGDNLAYGKFVTEVIELAKERAAKYEASGWGSISSRENADSILSSILGFKSLVDAGLQFDPTGYGACAWAIVSFGLQLVQYDKDRMGAIFESSAYLADLLAKWASIEKNYLSRPVDDSKELQKGIVKVYAAVLTFSAEVGKGARSGAVGRIRASFQSLTQQPMVNLKAKIIAVENTTSKWQEIVAQEYRVQEHEEIVQQVAEMTKSLNNIEKIAISTEQEGVLKWLSDFSLAAKWQTPRDVMKEHNPDSGKWLFESQEFNDWKSSPQSILWLYGKSGCGKSYLCSTIIAHLQSICRAEEQKLLICWYFESDNKATRSVKGMLRSLIQQLCRKMDNFPAAVKTLAEQYKGNLAAEPETEELMVILNTIIDSIEKDIFLVLDALDECGEEGTPSGQQTLKDLMHQIQLLVENGEKGHGNFHLLMTSREVGDIPTTFKNFASSDDQAIDIEDKVLVDLKSYTQNKMDNTPELKNLPDELKDEIMKKLEVRDERQFLWEATLLEEIIKCRKDAEMIQSVLDHVPETMELRYGRALSGIQSRRDFHWARPILNLMCVQMRPLKLEEIADFAKLEANEVIKICTSTLLRIDVEDIDGDRTEFVRFAHPSVQRYLMSTASQLNGCSFFVSLDEAHDKIAERSLCYLLDNSDKAFQRYSARYWFQHVQAIQVASKESKVPDLVYELFKPSSSKLFFTWLKCHDPDSGRSTQLALEVTPSSTYYAILLGFQEVAEKLIDVDETTSIENISGLHGTAMQLAVSRGYIQIVKRLLMKGINPNVNNGLRGRGSTLYLASSQGDERMIQMLIKAGVDINSSTGQFGGPLQHAAYSGNQDVVRQLLKADADPNLKGGEFGSALQAAAAMGHGKVVEVLLQNGADPNFCGGSLGSVLQAALTGGHGDVVKQLGRSRGMQYNPEGNVCWKNGFIEASNSEAFARFLHEMKLSVFKIYPGWPNMTLEQELLAQCPRFLDRHFRGGYLNRNLCSDAARDGVARSRNQFYAGSKLENDGYFSRAVFYGYFCYLIFIKVSPSKGQTLVQEIVTPLIPEMLDIAGCVDNYESIATKGNDTKYQDFKQSVEKLCCNLFLVLALSWAYPRTALYHSVFRKEGNTQANKDFEDRLVWQAQQNAAEGGGFASAYRALKSRTDEALWMWDDLPSLTKLEQQMDELRNCSKECQLRYDDVIQHHQKITSDEIHSEQVEAAAAIETTTTTQTQEPQSSDFEQAEAPPAIETTTTEQTQETPSLELNTVDRKLWIVDYGPGLLTWTADRGLWAWIAFSSIAVVLFSWLIFQMPANMPQ